MQFDTGCCVKKVNVDKFMEVYNQYARKEISVHKASKMLGVAGQTFEKWVYKLMLNGWKLEGLEFLVDDNGAPYNGI